MLKANLNIFCKKKKRNITEFILNKCLHVWKLAFPKKIKLSDMLNSRLLSFHIHFRKNRNWLDGLGWYIFALICFSFNFCEHIETLPFKFQVENPRFNLKLCIVEKFSEKGKMILRKNMSIVEDLDYLSKLIYRKTRKMNSTDIYLFLYQQWMTFKF